MTTKSPLIRGMKIKELQVNILNGSTYAVLRLPKLFRGEGLSYRASPKTERAVRKHLRAHNGAGITIGRVVVKLVRLSSGYVTALVSLIRIRREFSCEADFHRFIGPLGDAIRETARGEFEKNKAVRNHYMVSQEGVAI